MKKILLPFFITALLVGKTVAAELTVTYEAATTTDNKSALAAIQNDDLMEVVLGSINDRYSLPHPVTIVFADQDEDDFGPHYNPENVQIIIPYTFWTEVKARLTTDMVHNVDEQVLNTLAGDILIHTLYHELGHALIDIAELPITGREEDAADEFGALMMLNDLHDGDIAVLTAADFFALEGSEIEEFTDDDLFGVHALDDQRFFNLVCLTYGFGSEEAKIYLNDLEVEEDRMEICEEDFERRQIAWNELLEPITK